MIPASVERLLKDAGEQNINALLDDEELVFMVDWREEDDAIVEYCEAILNTGSLSAEFVDADTDSGAELQISYKGRTVTAPLIEAAEDRHITLHTLNQLLQPDYQVRVCVDSNGSDTLAFLPLTTQRAAS